MIPEKTFVEYVFHVKTHLIQRPPEIMNLYENSPPPLMTPRPT